ncbi:PR domain zinc finger protein 2 [Gadus chalcogrammus]|uniref:PR domain zinc finger protein 2 n=1 Tax=Gadus chalcogrammus TaxID=1042646 RepID=UPI0024C4D772|nr:PR domain zinc finger protein 2 [Gadus chalcogrammus]XP_056461940.1 PR domain zinc finger protein 2 [Gadus chalcogrammus]
MTEMWEGEQGPKEEVDERPSSSGPVHAEMNPAPVESPAPTDVQDMSVVMIDGKEEELETRVDKAGDAVEPQQLPTMQTPQETSLTAESREEEEQFPNCGKPGGESPQDLQPKSDSASLQGQELESLDADIDFDHDPDGDLEGDLQGESHPCLHCERHFSTKQGLERHIHIHTTANQQTHLFKCRYCGKSFGSQVGRRRHERRHESGAKKKPGSLAGTANLLSSGGKAGGSSPEYTSPTNYIAIGSQFPVAHQPIPELAKKESRPEADRPFTLEEYGESKELHPCKYCNKAFGTHTNMRRHQRRIHERHLLPKGVRRKGMLPQEVSVQRLPNESPSGSPPPVYVPSADTEDEADRDEYVVDISKNISENLSFYIDGKILSTSTVSNCEVIEVNSRSAALFGLDAMIISPSQISQAFKVESKPIAGKPLVSNLGQPTSKRRTTTPPLIPSLKMENETGFSASSSSSSSSTSSSSNVLVGGLFSQSTESLAFQKEKTVYLSPKLKQLLQSQDSQMSTISQIGDSHRLASPLSVTSLPGASGRFKRRTSSPPSSPQLSPTQKLDISKAEVGSLYTLKVPKLEGHRLSPVLNLTIHEDGDTVCTTEKDMSNRSSSNCGGNACNQQPLDLSSSVSKRSDVISKTLGDSALDLSMQRKSTMDPELKGNPPPQPPTKKRKPNTSMLEKVLMNEYAGLTSAGEEGPAALSSLGPLQPLSPSMTSESAHPSPPSLTPVTMNPSSPATSSMTSPTPPPPVLPTIPPDMPSSPRSEPSDCSVSRPLPVLSPKSSPRSNVDEVPSDTEEETSMAQEVQHSVDENHEQLDSAPHTPVKDPLKSSSTPSPTQPTPAEPPTVEFEVLQKQDNCLTNGKPESKDPGSITDAKSLSPDSAPLTSQPHSPAVPTSTTTSHNTSPPTLSPSVVLPVKKKDPVHYLEGMTDISHDADDSTCPAVKETPKEKGEDSETFCKTFECNVCEEPFPSIKTLNGHIVAHAVDWPYKCEFCVHLFVEARALLAHRTSLHGVGRIFVCSECSKEFAFLCNLEQHQKDLHPSQTCTHTTVESGKLRPHNYTDPSRAKEESRPSTPAPESEEEAAPEREPTEKAPEVNGKSADDEPEPEDSSEELYTTIKIMASEGGKPKGPDVRLGLNQHYPSFKPPPFPYHSRSHAGSVASATNFTTHNIPQTFSTAIRCTKCGNSFDNMPELHKHILACANASDKKRYTPKKNPIPLKQIVKPQNGALSPAAASAGQSAFRRMGQPKRLNFNQEASGKAKMSSLNKKKNQLVQKAISQKNKTASSVKKASVKVEEQDPEPHICPHCSREFTYPASLSKHIAISCPMKPEPKKSKKGDVKQDAPQMSLRRKATDADAPDSEPKPLGKTRARSYGAAEPELLPASKGRTGAPVGRPKRPASFPASPAVTGKKKKKGQAHSPPPPPPPAMPVPDTPSDPAQRPAVKAQRMGKEAAPKKAPEGNSPLGQQAKKEERFSLRTRERVGGPVTRSLQSVNTVATVEVKTEQPLVPETKEPQETPLK